jgi:hypothetical protein
MKTLKTLTFSLKFVIGLIFVTIFYSCQNSVGQDTIPNEVLNIEVVSNEVPFSYINESGTSVKSRFNTPKDFTRVESDVNSFGDHLQNLHLKSHGSFVKHFDGTTKGNTSAYLAVVDLPIGNKDLHQCADGVMRLRGDYLYSQKRYNEIEFLFVNGSRANYSKYLGGKTPSNSNYWSFMEYVFSYANTYSLDKQLKSKEVKDLEVGDVFIKGGFPGHTVIVVDKCVNKKGEVKFMLAQSYMPAQELQILVGDDGFGPWYDLNFGDYLYSAEYTFTKNQLKSF